MQHSTAPAISTGTTTSTGSHTALPHTPNCQRLLNDADHLLIGISPGNSYFGIPTLTRMLRWAHTTFQQVDVIIPDRSLAANYRARGYPEQAARKKAHTEIAGVRRRVRRAFEYSGIPEREQRAHLLSELAESAEYRAVHQRVRDALVSDERARRLCQEVTARTLDRSGVGWKAAGGGAADDDLTGLALDYLADELPFFIDTPGILGVPASLASYHIPIPLADLIYTRDGPLHAAADQGFILLTENSAGR